MKNYGQFGTNNREVGGTPYVAETRGPLKITRAGTTRLIDEKSATEEASRVVRSNASATGSP